MDVNHLRKIAQKTALRRVKYSTPRRDGSQRGGSGEADVSDCHPDSGVSKRQNICGNPVIFKLLNEQRSCFGAPDMSVNYIFFCKFQTLGTALVCAAMGNLPENRRPFWADCTGSTPGSALRLRSAGKSVMMLAIN